MHLISWHPSIQPTIPSISPPSPKEVTLCKFLKLKRSLISPIALSFSMKDSLLLFQNYQNTQNIIILFHNCLSSHRPPPNDHQTTTLTPIAISVCAAAVVASHCFFLIFFSFLFLLDQSKKHDFEASDLALES